MTEDVDEKIEQASDGAINVEGEAGEELASVLGVTGENPEEEKNIEEEKISSPKPKDITDNIKDKVYDVTMPSGFEGEVAGVEGDIVITDTDKELYLKGLLNDDSVILDIPFCNGKLVYRVRSKTGWEQTLAYEATVTSKAEDDPEELDYYQSMLKLQKIGATLQILAINGKPFSNLKFESAGDDWTEQIMKVREACDNTIEVMDSVKMTLTLNALRIFEYKVARMAASCNTGDFWVPAD